MHLSNPLRPHPPSRCHFRGAAISHHNACSQIRRGPETLLMLRVYFKANIKFWSFLNLPIRPQAWSLHHINLVTGCQFIRPASRIPFRALPSFHRHLLSHPYTAPCTITTLVLSEHDIILSSWIHIPWLGPQQRLEEFASQQRVHFLNIVSNKLTNRRGNIPASMPSLQIYVIITHRVLVREKGISESEGLASAAV